MVKGTERREKHKASEDKKYSVKHLAWGNLNPSNATCKNACVVPGDSQGMQETESTPQTETTL